MSSTEPTVCCGEPSACSISHGQYQNAEPLDFMSFNFGNTVGCHVEVEDCVPLSCRGPMTMPSRPNSGRRSEPASSDSKISSRKGSSLPNPKIKKQSTDIERSPRGTHGSRGSKTAHSIIERKYRENINSKITQLQDTLSVIDYFIQEDSRLPNEAPEPNAAKPRKGDILTRAIDYIQQAEIDKRHMSEEVRLLRSRVAAMNRPNGCNDCSLMHQLRALQLQVPIKT
jgi:Helix-loop-helix DNA-binding domain